MKMQEELNKIYDRTDMPENTEKKNALVHHPSEVEDGENVWKKLERARNILEEISENAQADNYWAKREFAQIIKSINKWLDDNNWSK